MRIFLLWIGFIPFAFSNEKREDIKFSPYFEREFGSLITREVFIAKDTQKNADIKYKIYKSKFSMNNNNGLYALFDKFNSKRISFYFSDPKIKFLKLKITGYESIGCQGVSGCAENISQSEYISLTKNEACWEIYHNFIVMELINL